MEFVNYAAEPLRLQVQVKGSFASVRYETPEHPCCESLAPVKHNGFTEFVIPELRIAGRVHLEAVKSRLRSTRRGPKRPVVPEELHLGGAALQHYDNWSILNLASESA